MTGFASGQPGETGPGANLPAVLPLCCKLPHIDVLESQLVNGALNAYLARGRMHDLRKLPLNLPKGSVHVAYHKRIGRRSPPPWTVEDMTSRRLSPRPFRPKGGELCQ